MVYIPKKLPKPPESFTKPFKYHLEPKDFYNKLQTKNKTFFGAKRKFLKRDELVKKITQDKSPIPKTGWAGSIRGGYSSREKRKQLAEALFPKEKFGDYVSKKAYQELIKELDFKSKVGKQSVEQHQAMQRRDYLKKKSGL